MSNKQLLLETGLITAVRANRSSKVADCKSEERELKGAKRLHRTGGNAQSDEWIIIPCGFVTVMTIFTTHTVNSFIVFIKMLIMGRGGGHKSYSVTGSKRSP